MEEPIRANNGAITPITFSDHPVIGQKMYNLILHLTLSAPLPNMQPFSTKDGSKIKLDYAINENTYIKYQPTWIPTILFGFPADSGADLNELTLKLISKVNEVMMCPFETKLN